MKIEIIRALLIFLCVVVGVTCIFSRMKITHQVDVLSIINSSTPVVTPQPGMQVEGHVTRQDGSGLTGVRIYRKYASYPGVLVATTDIIGYYRSEFQPIPGDEMISIYAELEGYSIIPKDSTSNWEEGSYYWRHYYGYEERVLDFLVEE